MMNIFIQRNNSWVNKLPYTEVWFVVLSGLNIKKKIKVHLCSWEYLYFILHVLILGVKFILPSLGKKRIQERFLASVCFLLILLQGKRNNFLMDRSSLIVVLPGKYQKLDCSFPFKLCSLHSFMKTINLYIYLIFICWILFLLLEWFLSQRYRREM